MSNSLYNYHDCLEKRLPFCDKNLKISLPFSCANLTMVKWEKAQGRPCANGYSLINTANGNVVTFATFDDHHVGLFYNTSCYAMIQKGEYPSALSKEISGFKNKMDSTLYTLFKGMMKSVDKLESKTDKELGEFITKHFLGSARDMEKIKMLAIAGRTYE